MSSLLTPVAGAVSSKTAISHIELERAADINGAASSRGAYISNIWEFVTASPHFRAAHHAPRWSPELISNSTLQVSHAELRIDKGPNRHKLILDTPNLALWHAGVQVRLEVVQKMEPKTGGLVKIFKGVVKVGDKATQRIEEDAALDPDVLASHGFLKAFKEGMKAEGKRDEYRILKASMRSASGQEITDKAFPIYPMLYFRTDTQKMLYSPEDNPEAVLELKTDDADWETVLQQTGHLAQIEIEQKYGPHDPALLDRELAILTARFPFLQASAVAKPQAGMNALAQYLCPANDMKHERRRTAFNQSALMPYLSVMKFSSVPAESLGLWAAGMPEPQAVA